MSAVEEQAKQVANTLEGLAPRLNNLMDELTPELRAYWRQRFSGVIAGLNLLINPVPEGGPPQRRTSDILDQAQVPGSSGETEREPAVATKK